MQRTVLRRGGLAILIFLAIGVAGLFGQVANGGFETNIPPNTFASWTVADQAAGSGSLCVQTGTGSPLNAFAVPAPTEGSFAAMTDQGGPGSHILYQNIAVPATGGTLTFDIFIQSFAAFANPSPETLDFNVFPNQHTRVDIMTTASAVDDVGAGVLQNVFMTKPGDPLTSGYNKITVPLAPFAGQTVRLRFAEVDNQLFFNVGIDNVQLSAGTCTLFGTDGSGGHLLRVDPATGVGTVVGAMGAGTVPSLAVDPTTFVMYAGQGAGAPNVYTVNTATGAAKLVGNSLLGFAAIGAMDFRADGTLFAAVNIAGDGGTGSDHLATISKVTGAATVIGPFGTCTGVVVPSVRGGLCTIDGMEAIAFEAAGKLWGAVSVRGAAGVPGLYTINTVTGAATFVAPILDSSSNPPSGGIVSLQFDCDGTLFGGTARAVSPATDGGKLVKINPVTGLFSFVGAVSATGGPSLAALAFECICPSNQCALTQGFWKNHPDAWPVTSLTLGCQTYTEAELLTILNTSVGSGKGADASLILAHQLIAAKLNIANGADPAPISATIADADALLCTFTGKLPYQVKPSSPVGKQMVADASALDQYNNGLLTPSCTP